MLLYVLKTFTYTQPTNNFDLFDRFLVLCENGSIYYQFRFKFILMFIIKSKPVKHSYHDNSTATVLIARLGKSELLLRWFHMTKPFRNWIELNYIFELSLDLLLRQHYKRYMFVFAGIYKMTLVQIFYAMDVLHRISFWQEVFTF